MLSRYLNFAKLISFPHSTGNASQPSNNAQSVNRRFTLRQILRTNDITVNIDIANVTPRLCQHMRHDATQTLDKRNGQLRQK